MALNQFEAQGWIAANIHGGDALLPETYRTLSSFTVLWNYFEQRKCLNAASPKVLHDLAQAFDPANGLNAELQEALAYWRQRYVERGAVNHLFETLHFRNGDNKAVATAAILGTTNDSTDLFEGLLTVIYRLRNNLFHGLKQLDQLNDQRENLANACLALAGAIRLLGG